MGIAPHQAIVNGKIGIVVQHWAGSQLQWVRPVFLFRNHVVALAQAVRAVFDLTPDGMIRALGLDRPGFAQFCNYGHFTHQEAPWEQTDRTEKLVEACHLQEVGVPKR